MNQREKRFLSMAFFGALLLASMGFAWARPLIRPGIYARAASMNSPWVREYFQTCIIQGDCTGGW